MPPRGAASGTARHGGAASGAASGAARGAARGAASGKASALAVHGTTAQENATKDNGMSTTQVSIRVMAGTYSDEPESRIY